jgi:hypothetical protein
MEYGPDAIERDSRARAAAFRDFRTVIYNSIDSMCGQAMLAHFSEMACSTRRCSFTDQ